MSSDNSALPMSLSTFANPVFRAMTAVAVPKGGHFRYAVGVQLPNR